MPTPRPIIAPSVIAKSGTDMTFDSSEMMPAPMPTPNRATPMGRPIARTDPNDTMRMTMANESPISSDSGGSNSPRAAPPTSICNPSTSAGTTSVARPSTSTVYAVSVRSSMLRPIADDSRSPTSGASEMLAEAMRPAASPSNATRPRWRPSSV